jgi:hypothetical protein
MPSNLILTGGHTHRFDVAAPALAALLSAQGIESKITDDIEAGLATLAETGVDLLTVYALRWTMATGDKYAPHRARWAPVRSWTCRHRVAPRARRRLARAARH